MVNDEINFEQSFIETLEKKDLKGDLIELADAGMGKLVASQEVLKELPWVKSLFGVYQFGIAVRDYLLIKKILRFLRELNDISEEERESMFWDLQLYSVERKKIGEQIIIILDKAEEEEKADLLGKLFKAYTKRQIDSVEFQRYSYIVSSLILSYLKYLPTYVEEQQGKYYSPALHSMGLLVRTSGFNNTGRDVEEDGYEISAMGKVLAMLLEL